MGLFAIAAGPAEGDRSHNNRGIDILHYTLQLDLSDINKGEIAGIADLQIKILTKELQTITLDLSSMNVDSVWIDEASVNDWKYSGDLLSIPLKADEINGGTLLVTVFYHGKPLKDPVWGGFYLFADNAFSMGVGMGSDPLAVGRFWYPCYDSFTERASYEYFITVKDDLAVACPGTMSEIFQNANGTTTWHWMMNNSIPTYLSSVAVADYVRITNTIIGKDRNIPVELFVSPGDKENALKSFEKLGNWLSCFENMFGPYRWEKIGYASVNFPHGAMEHATMIHIPSYSLKNPAGFQDLFVHEFAHSWFGNLITCASPADMWFNEGFASYCEALYHECSEGEQAFRDYMRINHLKSLHAAEADDGFRAIYGNPPEYTYGSTVYDKGADVAHTLRSYLGDKKFFPAMKAMFDKYAFNNISSRELQIFLEKETGTQLDDFFNFWVESPGFPHFSVDSFSVEAAESGYRVNVYVEQRLFGATDYSYSNRIDLMFVSPSWDTSIKSFEFSGPYGKEDFMLGFKPELIIIDPYEKIADATLDEIKIIKAAGEYSFDESGFILNVEEITDSAFFRITKHMVPPVSLDKSLTLPEDIYWTMESLAAKDFKASAIFVIHMPESAGLKNRQQFLRLLYRGGPGQNWNIIPSVAMQENEAYYLTSSVIKKGEYCIAFIK